MQFPLVTIIVTTYNSAKFVVETLESIKQQTYQNIELIVSDDCSKDNTVDLCKEWLSVNENKFACTQIITVPQNTGVSANCNRGIKAANAAWIKFIAGDDILLPNCIEANMKFVQGNSNFAVVFSKLKLYKNDFYEHNFLLEYPEPYPMNIMDPGFTALEQYKQLLISDRINYTPTSFFNKQVLVDLKGFDEENKLMEDYPMWLKITKANHKLYYFDIATVGYRKHDAASNNMHINYLFKPLYLKSGEFYKKNIYPNLPWDLACNKMYVLQIAIVFSKIGLNNNTATNRWLYNLLTVFVNPFQYIIAFKKKVLKMGKDNIFYSDKKNKLGA